MVAKIDLLLTVCDLYYKEKLTQSDIAKKVGLSRPTVAKLLDEALDKGIVQINILAPLALDEVVAVEIKGKYKLKKVLVIKNTENYIYDLDNLGKVTANFVNSIIKKNDIIGISWGKAVESFVTNTPESSWKNNLIVQINGSLGSSIDSVSGSELVIKLGERTNSQYELLTAPAVVDSFELQKNLLQQPSIRKVISLGNEMSIAISGIGNLKTYKNTLYSAGVIDKVDLLKLKEDGAVGHMACRMFSPEGKEVAIRNKWPISPSMKSFKRIPYSIGCAMGEDRALSVVGALNGQLINTLICDEALAQEILKIQI